MDTKLTSYCIANKHCGRSVDGQSMRMRQNDIISGIHIFSYEKPKYEAPRARFEIGTSDILIQQGTTAP